MRSPSYSHHKDLGVVLFDSLIVHQSSVV